MDFAIQVGVSMHTLSDWKKRLEEQGPAGLMDQPHGAKRGSGLRWPNLEESRQRIQDAVPGPPQRFYLVRLSGAADFR
jgi:transposase